MDGSPNNEGRLSDNNLNYVRYYAPPAIIFAVLMTIFVSLPSEIRSWMFIPLFVIFPLSGMWYTRHYIRQTYPLVRPACWQLHTFCPSLRIYPADATVPEDLEQVSHIEQQVVIQTTPQYPPSSAAPYPLSEAPFPTSGTPYPPYGAPVSDIPYGPPVDAPPPSYISVTEGRKKISGGWFTARQ